MRHFRSLWPLFLAIIESWVIKISNFLSNLPIFSYLKCNQNRNTVRHVLAIKSKLVWLNDKWYNSGNLKIGATKYWPKNPPYAIVCHEFDQSKYCKYRLIHCISSYFRSEILQIFSNHGGILLQTSLNAPSYEKCTLLTCWGRMR